MRTEYEIMIARLAPALAAVVALGTAAPTLTQTAAAPPADASAPGASSSFAPEVERLADRLASTYVMPEVGRRYAAMLRANLSRGVYARIVGPDALSNRLTDDLQSVAPDRHLRVRPIGSGPGGPRSPRSRPAPIEDAKWIAPGVAYVRLNLFPGDADSVAATARFMREHAAARVLIFDARQHHGGGMDEMNVILPYLYARPTRLVAMDTAEAMFRRDGPMVAESAGFRRVTAPAGLVRHEHWAIPSRTERRLFKARVFYLTSTVTGSAAEHLALAFKRTGRATLVGEHTGGANHFGGFEPLGGRLEVFLPVGRTIDPDTGRDWEGTGVLPDVAVPADRALDEALRLAGVQPER